MVENFREVRRATSGKITQTNSTENGVYVVGSDTSVTATAAAPLDSYMLFLDEKQNKGTYRTSNKAQVTFDRNIKAVLYGNSSTGKTKVEFHDCWRIRNLCIK